MEDGFPLLCKKIYNFHLQTILDNIYTSWVYIYIYIYIYIYKPMRLTGPKVSTNITIFRLCMIVMSIFTSEAVVLFWFPI